MTTNNGSPETMCRRISKSLKALSGKTQVQKDLSKALDEEDLDGFQANLNKDECDPNFDVQYKLRVVDVCVIWKTDTRYLKALIDKGVDVNEVNGPYGMAPVHFAACSEGNLNALKFLAEHGGDLNALDFYRSTPLHYIVEESWETMEQAHVCLDYLLSWPKLKLNVPNVDGYTAIHLAACCNHMNAVEKMLKFRASELDLDSYKVNNRTARDEITNRLNDKLHDKLTLPDEASRTINNYDEYEMLQLLKEGKYNSFQEVFRQEMDININAQGADGNTLLHYAAKQGEQKCVLWLLKKGADISIKNNENKTPLENMQASTLQEYLDSTITISGENNDINIDYSFLRGKSQANPQEEYDLLLEIAKTHGFGELLSHPVLRGFVSLKWQQYQMFFYFNMLFYSMFCVVLTIYVILGHRKRDANVPHDTENMADNRGFITDHEQMIAPMVANVTRVILIICLTYFALRELLQFCLNRRKYVKSFENWLEVALVTITSVVVYKDCSREFSSTQYVYVCPQLRAFAMLLCWLELLLLYGKHPYMSTNVEMFKRVSWNFFTFLSWYAILIIAFGLSFYTLYRGCSGDCNADTNPFHNSALSIFRTTIMMTGEFNSGDIPFMSFPGTSHVIFIAFVFLVAIVLMNLLNGLAVSDTQIIRADASRSSLVTQIKVICQTEVLLQKTQGFLRHPLFKVFYMCLRGVIFIFEIASLVVHFCFCCCFCRRWYSRRGDSYFSVITILQNKNNKIVLRKKSREINNDEKKKDFIFEEESVKAIKIILAERQRQSKRNVQGFKGDQHVVNGSISSYSSADSAIDLRERFEALEERFIGKTEVLENKFEVLEDKFIALEKRFEALDEKFVLKTEALGEKFEALDEKLNTKLLFKINTILEILYNIPSEERRRMTDC